MKKVFFSFSSTARAILEGKLTCDEVEVLVANTAADNAQDLANGYSYMGKGIEEVAEKLFPKMVQYRKSPSFVDYFIDKRFNSIINITAVFGRIKGDSFKDVYQAAWEREEKYPHSDDEELSRSRAYWDKIFTECGLL